MTSKFWLGKPPVACDLCSAGIETQFFDAKTHKGPWGNLCPKCFAAEGRGLGTGLGQRYDLNEDGHWEKTGG